MREELIVSLYALPYFTMSAQIINIFPCRLAHQMFLGHFSKQQIIIQESYSDRQRDGRGECNH